METLIFINVVTTKIKPLGTIPGLKIKDKEIQYKPQSKKLGLLFFTLIYGARKQRYSHSPPPNSIQEVLFFQNVKYK